MPWTRSWYQDDAEPNDELQACSQWDSIQTEAILAKDELNTINLRVSFGY